MHVHTRNGVESARQEEKRYLVGVWGWATHPAQNCQAAERSRIVLRIVVYWNDASPPDYSAIHADEAVCMIGLGKDCKHFSTCEA